MQRDGPTPPNLGRYTPAPGAANQPDAVAPDRYDLSGAPTWPGVGAAGRRARASRQIPGGYVSATAFGISLGTNVALLISLIALLLLSHVGALSPGGAAGPSAPALASGSPTATLTPAATLTPSTGWLRALPGSVQLGCGGDQHTQLVLLQNSGPSTVAWQATFTVPAGQAGVSVAPQQGQLAAGASVSLQIQNTTHATGPQGTSGKQGVINLTPAATDAGPPASVSYTTTGCK